MKVGSISISSIPTDGLRLDPSSYLCEGEEIRKLLQKSPYGLKTVSDLADDIFLGNIFSRCFVKDKEHGLVYLSPSDTVKTDIETGKFLSNKQAMSLSKLMLKKDWILVTCSGTLGLVTYTNNTFNNKIATHDLIRIIPCDSKYKKGCLYAFLSSKYGYYQLTQSRFGGVVKHINDKQTGAVIVPSFPPAFQDEVDLLIKNCSKLREEATQILEKTDYFLKSKAGLKELTTDDYDYFGPRSVERKVSCFKRSIKDVGTITFNAFNHSERIKKLKKSMLCNTVPLREVLQDGAIFSTGSFPRIEVKEGHGIMLINQQDIFDRIIVGKNISKRNVKTTNLVEYGEILLAGVGTLGESETFCRCIFANEDLEEQLVSGEFVRMKTKGGIPSGYIYAWLNSDYGFRFIRNTQTGSKLCRPIPRLLLEIPVPVIGKESMEMIDSLVREAHTKRHRANQMELKAIRMVEEEIEKWNN